MKRYEKGSLRGPKGRSNLMTGSGRAPQSTPRRLLRLRLAMTLLLALFTVTVAAVPAYAAVEGGPIRKLGRSVANLLTGWMELPVQVMQTTERSGSLAGMTVGFGRGVVLGLGRTLVGAIELISFPIPNPTTGYGPVIEPEFVKFRDADR